MQHNIRFAANLAATGLAAERAGFEPAVGSHLRLISSQVHKRAFSIGYAIFL